MSGVMLVKQKVADVAQWNTVFSDPQLDAGASIAPLSMVMTPKPSSS